MDSMRRRMGLASGLSKKPRGSPLRILVGIPRRSSIPRPTSAPFAVSLSAVDSASPVRSSYSARSMPPSDTAGPIIVASCVARATAPPGRKSEATIGPISPTTSPTCGM